MSSARETLPRLIATLGGLGKFPRAPGTAASLIAAALYGALAALDARLPLLFLIILLPLAAWAAGRYAAALGLRDPPEIVVDEWAGQLVCLMGAPPTPAALAAGFLLFRLFDIIKPPPVRRLERLPGGLGILADDIAAGAMGWAALFCLSWFGVV